LVTNYLAKGTGTVGATSDTLVPTIHITPQSPNGNHVLGKKNYLDCALEIVLSYNSPKTTKIYFI
jgi:hypothetical protein